MKQVFPNIRPRRLGTRGNSRYCYAAMRKATKLEAPSLPDFNSTGLNNNNNNHNNNNYLFDPQKYEDSWKLVQKWAEDILTSNFDTLEDLASFINKQPLNLPTSLTSKQLIQSKLKNKRRLNVSIKYFCLIIIENYKTYFEKFRKNLIKSKRNRKE